MDSTLQTQFPTVGSLMTSAAAWLWPGFSMQVPQVAIQDGRGEAWYKAHPNMAHINRVNQEYHQIVDEYGRTRFFHGTNVVMKEAPWYRPFDWAPGVSTFGEQDVKNMHDMGMNVVRLGHHWAGAEPVRGEYNQTFLDIMKEQTKLAEDHGIYVLVDVHQDKLARQFCGHGVPDWFVKKDWMPESSRFPAPVTEPYTTDSGGFPSPTSQCGKFPWEMYYGTYAASNAFGRLYNNHDGLRDAFAAYWKKLASEYVETNNVIGYNLLNEPWAGDVWANPLLWGFGMADHMVLEEVWNKVSEQIREVDNGTLIWFEGTTWDIESGFNDVPLGDGSKTVHSFHYYHPPQLWSIWNTLKNRDIDNQRLKTAGVLTELTFWDWDGSELKDLADAMRATDAHMVSWMGWGYEDLYDGSGQPKPELAKQYSRPYPAAVAGKAYSYNFEEFSGTFTLKFRSDPDMDAPTEIILPPSTFPKKPFIAIEPEGSMEEYQKDNRTLALFTSKSLQTPRDIKVTIQVRK